MSIYKEICLSYYDKAMGNIVILLAVTFVRAIEFLLRKQANIGDFYYSY